METPKLLAGKEEKDLTVTGLKNIEKRLENEKEYVESQTENSKIIQDTKDQEQTVVENSEKEDSVGVVMEAQEGSAGVFKDIDSDRDERLHLILDTFADIGDILVFKDEDIVITRPLEFVKGLTANIINHNIEEIQTKKQKEQEGKMKGQDIQNILRKGFYHKDFCSSEKTWEI